jgi:hypothetical protein
MPHTGSFGSFGAAGSAGVIAVMVVCVHDHCLFLVVVGALGRLRMVAVPSMATVAAVAVHQVHADRRAAAGRANNLEHGPSALAAGKNRDQGNRYQRHTGWAAPKRWRMGVVVMLIHGVTPSELLAKGMGSDAPAQLIENHAGPLSATAASRTAVVAARGFSCEVATGMDSSAASFAG